MSRTLNVLVIRVRCHIGRLACGAIGDWNHPHWERGNVKLRELNPRPRHFNRNCEQWTILVVIVLQRYHIMMAHRPTRWQFLSGKGPGLSTAEGRFLSGLDLGLRLKLPKFCSVPDLASQGINRGPATRQAKKTWIRRWRKCLQHRSWLIADPWKTRNLKRKTCENYNSMWWGLKSAIRVQELHIWA